jgi:DNA-binding MarR family transcriptional regulator
LTINTQNQMQADHEDDEPFGRLLRWALDALEHEIYERFAQAGFADLRRSHAAVTRVLDEEGTRPSVLAERSGLTRQAMTQIVDSLERLGYVKRGPDPRDRRAQLVTYTARGRKALRLARSLQREIEERWGERVGRDRLEVARAVLGELARR